MTGSKRADGAVVRPRRAGLTVAAALAALGLVAAACSDAGESLASDAVGLTAEAEAEAGTGSTGEPATLEVPPADDGAQDAPAGAATATSGSGDPSGSASSEATPSSSGDPTTSSTGTAPSDTATSDPTSTSADPGTTGSTTSASTTTTRAATTTTRATTTTQRTTTTRPPTTTTSTTSTTSTTTLGSDVHPDIVRVIDVPGRNPRGRSWADSYSVGDQCFCFTTFDHGIGDIEVDTPAGRRTVREVCDRIGDGPGIDGRPIYNDIQCGNGPANDAGDETDCPGRVDIGREGCGHIGPTWDLTAFR